MGLDIYFDLFYTNQPKKGLIGFVDKGYLSDLRQVMKQTIAATLAKKFVSIFGRRVGGP